MYQLVSLYREYFSLSGVLIKALTEDDFGKINNDNKHAFLEPSLRNACLMELLTFSSGTAFAFNLGISISC